VSGLSSVGRNADFEPIGAPADSLVGRHPKEGRRHIGDLSRMSGDGHGRRQKGAQDEGQSWWTGSHMATVGVGGISDNDQPVSAWYQGR